MPVYEVEFQRKTPSVIWRFILTLVIVVLAIAVNMIVGINTTISFGQSAAGQFANSSDAAVTVPLQFWVSHMLGLSAIITFLLLCLIWWPVVRSITRTMTAVMIAGAALLATAGGDAKAYYDKTDVAEAVFILPNESAFFIPDVGANKDSQAKFGSEEYLNQNKVAAKRFQIPHAKFSGSGGTYSIWSDFYVPTSRLIIVDRTPYNREWTASTSTGTSSKNESFPCQSSEGLNMTAEVAIAASVSEDNVAKFLYYFGVNPPVGDRSRPEVIFTSVYYGKSLAQVMDTVGRGKVQSIVCHEFAARTFDEGNKHLNEVMTNVEKNVGDFLASRGITLDYIGWAGTITFDKDVQQAVNDRYTAEHLAPILPVMQQKAEIAIQTAAATAIMRWDGKLPAQISGLWIVPGAWVDVLSQFVKPVAPPAK